MNELTTSTAPQNASGSLPTAWVDRLFERLHALYGRRWLAMWTDIPMPQVKAAWADALTGCSADEIRQALNHLSQNERFPPTAPEFSALCRTYRIRPEGRLALSPPRSREDIDPRVRAEIAKWLTAGRKRDPRDWARSIIAGAADGSYTYPLGIQLAREALGLDRVEPEEPEIPPQAPTAGLRLVHTNPGP
jgi:hypothetical protein